MPERLILQAPAARRALLRGVDTMAALLRPTLGPVARTVAVMGFSRTNPPEILDSAATIARRTIQLDDPFEDMGGMLVRQLAWAVFEQAGDGSATAAVLAQGLLHAAAAYVAAGGNPMSLKRGVERALPVALAELRRQARPIDLPAEIAGVVRGIVRDARLADVIGEIMDSVGTDGAVLIEDGRAVQTTHEYIDGVRWEEGFLSTSLLKEGETQARLLEPRVFVTDRWLDSAEQLLPVVEACVAAGGRSLFIVAAGSSDAALSLLIVNRDRGVLDSAVVVRAPASGAQRTRIVEDLAVLTGGRCVRQDVGERVEDVTVDDLGGARQGWATGTAFGLLGPRGSRDAVRRRIGEAKGELHQVGREDDHTRDKIRERIGKLAGAAAIVRVGAATDSDRAELRLRVEAAVTAARAAVREGVVPGGGMAYLACVPALEELACVLSRGEGSAGDEALGVRLVARALAEPMRAIAENSGVEAGPLLHEARKRGPGCTFDAVRREWVDAWEAGILDPLPVASTALEMSVSAALMGLTTEVLIRHKKPATAQNP